MGCLKLSYYEQETERNAFRMFIDKNCLTSNFSENNVRSSYELSNHLGNVLATVSDLRLADNGTDIGNNGTVDFYTADVKSTNLFYPFGSTFDMPRGINDPTSEGYRYGFQGQEGDSEIKGVGNSWNYKYRMHDPRLGRFLSLDPLTASYPFYSPYHSSGNRPIACIDIDGLEPKEVIVAWSVTEPIKGFIKGALDIQQEVLDNTQWFHGKGHTVWEVQKPGAITFGSTVYYSPGWAENMNVYSWVSLVGHEETHRRDYETQGFFGFLKNYLNEYESNLDEGMAEKEAYKNIKSEIDAYNNEDLIDNFFNTGNNKSSFDKILYDGNLSKKEKMKQLQIIGIEKVAIPRLQGIQDRLEMKLLTDLDSKTKAFIQGAIEQIDKEIKVKQNEVKEVKKSN